jgi:hypothetical protein
VQTFGIASLIFNDLQLVTPSSCESRANLQSARVVSMFDMPMRRAGKPAGCRLEPDSQTAGNANLLDGLVNKQTISIARQWKFHLSHVSEFHCTQRPKLNHAAPENQTGKFTIPSSA